MTADRLSRISAIRRGAENTGKHNEINVVHARKNLNSMRERILLHHIAEMCRKLRAEAIHAVLIVAKLLYGAQLSLQILIARKVCINGSHQLLHGAQSAIKHGFLHGIQAVRHGGDGTAEQLIVIAVKPAPDRLKPGIQHRGKHALRQQAGLVAISLLVLANGVRNAPAVQIKLVIILSEEAGHELLEGFALAYVAAFKAHRQLTDIALRLPGAVPLAYRRVRRVGALLAVVKRKLQAFHALHLPEENPRSAFQRHLCTSVVGIAARGIQRNAPTKQLRNDMLVHIQRALALTIADQLFRRTLEICRRSHVIAHIDMRLGKAKLTAAFHNQYAKVAAHVIALLVNAAQHHIHQRIAGSHGIQLADQLTQKLPGLAAGHSLFNTSAISIAQLYIKTADAGGVVDAAYPPGKIEQLHGLFKVLWRSFRQCTAVLSNARKPLGILRQHTHPRCRQCGMACNKAAKILQKTDDRRKARAAFLLYGSIKAGLRTCNQRRYPLTKQKSIIQRIMTVVLPDIPRLGTGIRRDVLKLFNPRNQAAFRDMAAQQGKASHRTGIHPLEHCIHQNTLPQSVTVLPDQSSQRDFME